MSFLNGLVGLPPYRSIPWLVKPPSLALYPGNGSVVDAKDVSVRFTGLLANSQKNDELICS